LRSSPLFDKMCSAAYLDSIRTPEKPKDHEDGDALSPFVTPETTRLLELAIDESQRLGVEYIGTEHIVLAFAKGKYIDIDMTSIVSAVDEYVKESAIPPKVQIELSRTEARMLVSLLNKIVKSMQK
jgi:hypothetical protein